MNWIGFRQLHRLRFQKVVENQRRACHLRVVVTLLRRQVFTVVDPADKFLRDCADDDIGARVLCQIAGLFHDGLYGLNNELAVARDKGNVADGTLLDRAWSCDSVTSSARKPRSAVKPGKQGNRFGCRLGLAGTPFLQRFSQPSVPSMVSADPTRPMRIRRAQSQRVRSSGPWVMMPKRMSMWRPLPPNSSIGSSKNDIFIVIQVVAIPRPCRRLALGGTIFRQPGIVVDESIDLESLKFSKSQVRIRLIKQTSLRG